jgi:hypothetical protein
MIEQKIIDVNQTIAILKSINKPEKARKISLIIGKLNVK